MRACTLCKKLFAEDLEICPDDQSATVSLALDPLPEGLATRFPEAVPLASGATGTLYAVDGEAPLVLKVLSAELTSDPAVRGRYRRDLRKQLGIEHPNLSRVSEEGESEGRVFMLRQRVSGESLAQWLHRAGAGKSGLTLPQVYEVIVQLASALDGLHRSGLVHRDLKTGHVLVRKDLDGSGSRQLQLIDAAVAAPIFADRAEPRGTVDYLAPELIDGGTATFRSDLYALGCLGFQLLTGRAPFRGATDDATLAAHRNAQSAELPPGVPQTVRTLISSMLANDPRRRPFSAQQVRRALEPLLTSQTKAAHSGGRRMAHLPAVTLRMPAVTAKPRTPATPQTPYDVTVELDVEELDKAIQASDDDTSATGSPDGSVDKIVTPRSNSGAIKPAPEIDDDAPTIALPVTGAAPGAPGRVGRSRTGTHFGLGPVRSADVTAAAAKASGTALAGPSPRTDQTGPREHAELDEATRAQRQDPTERIIRHREPSVPRKPVSEDPSVVLWAAGALVLLLLAVRLVLGPAPHHARSQSVVVRVPGGTASSEANASGSPAGLRTQTDVKAATAARAEPSSISEQALIGAHMAARPRSGSERSGSERSGAEPRTSSALIGDEQERASASAPVPSAVVPELLDDAAQNVTQDVRTVSAAQVGQGISHANRSRGDVDYKALARKLYQSGSYREAARAYQRATQHDGSDAGAYAGLGAARLASGETRRAISAYQRAVQLEPGVAGFQAALGRAYLSQGDRARARAAYSKALKLDPNNRAAQTGMASAKAR